MIHIMIKLTCAGNFIFVNQFISNYAKAINRKPPYDRVTFPFDKTQATPFLNEYRCT